MGAPGAGAAGGVGGYRVLTDEKETVRLGAVLPDGRLDPDRRAHALETVSRFAETARGYGADLVRAVATAAVRDASDGPAFAAELAERCGVEVEVLGGDEEARLAHVSVARAFDLTHLEAAVLDIGGGSTDLALSASGVIERLVSVPIGALRLATEFGACDRGSRSGYAAMRKAVGRALDRHLPALGVRPAVVFGTGGTFTALASMLIAEGRGGEVGGERVGASAGSGRGGGSEVRGFSVRLSDVAHAIERLRRMDDAGRAKVAGVSSSRAGIIIPGLSIVDAVMRRLHVNTLRVHDRGVRDGLILEMLGHSGSGVGPRSGEARDWRSGVLAFGKRCGFDRAQSEHVAGLALELFDRAGDVLPEAGDFLDERGRRVLEAAALLRDVGYFINYKGHHKHSYHLILHADLPGFGNGERELVAVVARYHRGKRPKRKHDAFGALSATDRRRVEVLASLLRVADGLDRTHSGSVVGVALERSGETVRVVAEAASEPTADLWGAKRKADVLERVFGVEVEVDWSGGVGD